MVTAVITWDGKQNIVIVREGETQIRIPLDDFLTLPAVKYAIDLVPTRAAKRVKVVAPRRG